MVCGGVRGGGWGGSLGKPSSGGRGTGKSMSLLSPSAQTPLAKAR